MTRQNAKKVLFVICLILIFSVINGNSILAFLRHSEPATTAPIAAEDAIMLTPGARLDISCEGDLYVLRRSSSEVGLVCDWPTPISTLTPTPTSTPTSTPVVGRPFGPFNFPPSEAGDWPFTASRLGRNLNDLETARDAGLQVLVALTGGRSSYTDGNGCFSMVMWQAALDGNDLVAIQSYVDDGTIVGLYAIDEPHDWNCGPTYTELNEVCRYANGQLPGICCGFNAPPNWLAEGLDKTNFDQLGFLFTQSNFQRTSNWAMWAEQQVEDATWFDGPLWLSMNVVTGSPSVAQIQDAGVALCQANSAAGVMMWRWPTGFNRPGMMEAMEDIVTACGWEE